MAVMPTADGRDGSNSGALEARREREMVGHDRGGRGPWLPPDGWAWSRSKTRRVDHAEGVQPVQRRARALQGLAEGAAAVAAAEAEAAPTQAPVPPPRQQLELCACSLLAAMSMGSDVDRGDIADRPP